MSKPNILSLSITKNYIKELVGDNGIKLIQICKKKKKKIKDEEIGKKLKHLKITEIRAILNKLHFKGIADYNKKRDTKSGWYHYTWEIKDKRIAELVLLEQKEILKKLENKTGFEENHEFFSCKKKCDNIAFEIAAEYNFKCPQCGNAMDVIDTKKELEKRKKQINIIKKEIEMLTKMKAKLKK